MAATIDEENPNIQRTHAVLPGCAAYRMRTSFTPADDRLRPAAHAVSTVLFGI
jgi:hypothetical protein